MRKETLIWVLVDERPGTGKQALAVAESLKLPFVVKKMTWLCWANLPSQLSQLSKLSINKKSRERLCPPWPEMIISSGRRAAAIALNIKKKNAPNCKLVQIMDPGAFAHKNFSLIAIPKHDKLLEAKPNILRIIGAPSFIDDKEIINAKIHWKEKFGSLRRPIFALFIGGPTKRRPFSVNHARELGERVSELVKNNNGQLIITTSPRTGKLLKYVLDIFKERGIDPAYVYDCGISALDKKNPYFGFLSYADYFIVTGESTSMCSELCSLSKPTYIFAPTGFLAPKHQRFVNSLIKNNYAGLLGDMTENKTMDKFRRRLNTTRSIIDRISKFIN